MRIALFSDIHGNLPALEAAWRTAACESPDLALCLGDLVQYGPCPGEVVSFLRSHGVETVQGNCDRAAGRGRKTTGDDFENPHWRHLAGEALAWTRDNLRPEARKYLRTLPDSLHFLADRLPVLCVHGLPGKPAEGLPPNTAHEVYDLTLRLSRCRILACGHTHVPMVIRRPEGLIVNPGSVGGGTRPSGGTLALIRLTPGEEPDVSILPFDYDFRELEDLHREAGLPEIFLRCMRLGRDPRGPWHTTDPFHRQAWADPL